MKKLFKLLIASVFASSFCVGTAFALPALQLGNGSGDWVYDTTTSTWVTTSDSFTLNAYANATLDDGGNGDYAWDSAANVMTAYLVASAIPGTTTDPAFGISLTGGPSVSLVGSGYGTPPVEDLNSLSPHGVYPTYFEIYEFVFDPTTKGL
ncbi:MAG: choice-of-anchor N protein, partial [Gammaproteobacteria bacterium]|nr:choice-of-anchor N protein [Gammaproteobacteria bacterium]